MPEGDTIHKIANWLAPRLEGRCPEAVTLPGRRESGRFDGRCVAGVRVIGKHLFIDFDNDEALRSHLGMYGSWHFYRTGETWKKPQRQASVIIKSEDVIYVCFNAKEVEVVAAPSVRRRIIDTRLGPDLIGEPVEPDYLARRARELLEPDELLMDALLDQRVASGIGNVYKSETLFIERIAPRARLADVSDERLCDCFDTAGRLLRANLGGGKRVTRFEGDGAGRLWVYGRNGKPCHECARPVRSKRMGRHHRSTYWCEACQSPQP